MTARYALYFSPQNDSELSQFGNAVLGRTAIDSRQKNATCSFAHHKRWLDITEKPAHYGFHATLKAPFELNPEFIPQQLLDAVSEFSTAHRSIPLTDLSPSRLSHFAALTLPNQPELLQSFALRCVEAFERFRQPLSDADMRRRTSRPLTHSQLQLLERFGYPYVGDEFHFHMTLSGELDDKSNDFLEWLNELYVSIVSAPPVLDQITVFTQTDRQSPFVQLAAYSLG